MEVKSDRARRIMDVIAGPDSRKTKPMALGDITNHTRPINLEDCQKVIKRQKSHVEAVSNDFEVFKNAIIPLNVVDDIDQSDANDPLAVTEYVDELYDIFRRQERRSDLSSDAISRQPHVTGQMYSILIDWIVEIHLRFRLVPDTLYLTVSLIQRYLQKVAVARADFQLVGVTCLLLASKYEEIYPPDLRDLVFMTDQAYNKKQILAAETDVLEKLEFQLTFPTAYFFLLRYLKAAHADRRIVQLSCYICENMLGDCGMMKHLSSVVASAAIYLARKSFGRKPWSATLESYTKYKVRDLKACLEDMCRVMKAENHSLRALREKFSTKQFGRIALVNVKWEL